MKLITAEGHIHIIPTISSFRLKGRSRINRGFFRWILLLIIFWPALLCWFFVGTEVYVVEVNGASYNVGEEQYKLLVEKALED